MLPRCDTLINILRHESVIPPREDSSASTDFR